MYCEVQCATGGMYAIRMLMHKYYGAERANAWQELADLGCHNYLFCDV